MKKIILGILILAISVSILGCVDEKTHHTEKEVYYAGETIALIDNKTDAQLGKLKITNVSVLRDEPYTRKEYLCNADDYTDAMKAEYGEKAIIIGSNVYYWQEYAAVVQIDYEASTIDSGNQIDGSNFIITDCNGNEADDSVDVPYVKKPTHHNSMIVGLRDKGPVVLIFSFHHKQFATCTIICEYDYDTNQYIIREDKSSIPQCPSCEKEVDAQDAYCKYCGKALK